MPFTENNDISQTFEDLIPELSDDEMHLLENAKQATSFTMRNQLNDE